MVLVLKRATGRPPGCGVRHVEIGLDAHVLPVARQGLQYVRRLAELGMGGYLHFNFQGVVLVVAGVGQQRAGGGGVEAVLGLKVLVPRGVVVRRAGPVVVHHHDLALVAEVSLIEDMSVNSLVHGLADADVQERGVAVGIAARRVLRLVGAVVAVQEPALESHEYSLGAMLAVGDHHAPGLSLGLLVLRQLRQVHLFRQQRRHAG